MTLNSTIVNGKIHKKNLVIELEEDEDVHQCIKEAMENHNISKAQITKITGCLNKVSLNYFQKSTYKNKSLCDAQVVASSGHFELTKKNGLYGTIKIAVREFAKNNTYTLVKASAKNGLKIDLEFFEMN